MATDQLNPTYQPNSIGPGNTPYSVSTPSPITPASLTSTENPISLPPTPTYHTPDASISSFDSLLTNYQAPTAEASTLATNKSNIQTLMDKLLGKTAAQNTADQNFGVIDYTAQLKALDPQLTDLQNQYKDLNNQAANIPNIIQEQAAGRGVTAAGIAPQTASELRKNAIQAGTVASKFLALNSQAAILQGNLSNAKDLADRAVNAQFEPLEKQLDYETKLYALNKDSLDRADKQKSDLLGIQLQERSRQLDDAKADKSTIVAMANATVKNFPNDPQAQYAAQQALQANDLQTAFRLVGQYQQDPQAAAKAIAELAQTRAQTTLAYANVAKINADIKATQIPITPTEANAPYINAFNNATAGMGAQAAAAANKVFANYVAQGDLAGAKSYIVRTALANAGVDQQNQAIGRSQALSALQDIQSLLDQAAAKGANTNILTGNATNVAEKLGTTNSPDLSYIGSRISAILQTYRRAMTGVAFSPAESAQYEKLFPGTTKTGELNTAKLQALTDSLNSNNKAALSFYIGDQNYDALFPNQNTATLPSNQGQSAATGQTTTINGHQYKSDGTQWVLVQ